MVGILGDLDAEIIYLGFFRCVIWMFPKIGVPQMDGL